MFPPQLTGYDVRKDVKQAETTHEEKNLLSNLKGIHTLHTLHSRLNPYHNYHKTCKKSCKTCTSFPDLISIKLCVYNQWRQSEFIFRGRNFYLTARQGDEAEDLVPRAGVGFLGRGSEPPPHQLGSLGSAVSSPSGIRADPRKI